MEDWQRRVIEEKNILDGKILGLAGFTKTGTFRSIPIVDQELMHEQLRHMRRYQEVLGLRIGRFGK